MSFHPPSVHHSLWPSPEDLLSVFSPSLHQLTHAVHPLVIYPSLRLTLMPLLIICCFIFSCPVLDVYVCVCAACEQCVSIHAHKHTWTKVHTHTTHPKDH